MKRLLAALALAAPAAFVGGAILAAAPIAGAEDKMADLGLAVGAKAPAIQVTTQAGAPATLADITGEKGVVLAFVRSADWCPFCKKQLEELNSISADLESRGYKLAALSYDSVDTLKGFADKKSLAYTLLSDPESKAIDAFDVRNKDAKGKRFEGIPHPIVFIIGADGVIKAKLFEEDYKVRPQPAAVLLAVDGLRAAG
ncbi:redoxin domain-containing protein [bacterium]|nr:redoxin domain-containing protein [bacterium]